jgi:signal transduction histidine kinase
VKARLATVRVRTTLAATVVVGLAMIAGAILLVGILRENLTDAIENAVDLRALDIVANIESGSGAGSLAIDDRDDMLVQVVATDGTVVASSHNVAGLPPVVRLSPGQSEVVTVPIDDTDFLATAHAARTPDGELLVLVARTIDTVADSTRTVTRLLAVGVPLMLLLVAAITWRVVGRALAPVEAIRAEVDEVSAAQLHRRVPIPPGQDEISRLASTMNRMLARLEQAQARQSRFISDASHELRSPVASIRQHAEVALAHPEATDIAELAETVLAENLRVQHLVEDLLLLARADEHALGLNRRPLDLDDIVFDEARRLRGATELRVETIGVSAGRVDGDATGLRRVLRNLGDNAGRHARSRVAFALAAENGNLLLAVDDDGPGIPEADRAVVLERFVRLDDARARDAGGSGLGLAIVSELVEAHGGRVTISDSPLGGARVEVRLPGSTRPDG